MNRLSIFSAIVFCMLLLPTTYAQNRPHDVFVPERSTVPEQTQSPTDTVPEVTPPETQTGFATPQAETTPPPAQESQQRVMVLSWTEIESMFKKLDTRVTNLETRFSSFERRLAALEGRSTVATGSGGSTGNPLPRTGFATSWDSVPARRTTGGGCTGNYRTVPRSTVRYTTQTDVNGYVLGPGETLVAVNGVPVSASNPIPQYTPVVGTVPLGSVQAPVRQTTRTVRVPMQAKTTSQTTYTPTTGSARPRLGSRVRNFLGGGRNCPGGFCPN